jgi:hypothetical protein
MWVTVAASAVHVPLGQDIACYQTGVHGELAPAAATSTAGATSLYLGIVLLVIVVGLASVARARLMTTRAQCPR